MGQIFPVSSIQKHKQVSSGRRDYWSRYHYYCSCQRFIGAREKGSRFWQKLALNLQIMIHYLRRTELQLVTSIRNTNTHNHHYSSKKVPIDCNCNCCSTSPGSSTWYGLSACTTTPEADIHEEQERKRCLKHFKKLVSSSYRGGHGDLISKEITTKCTNWILSSTLSSFKSLRSYVNFSLHSPKRSKLQRTSQSLMLHHEPIFQKSRKSNIHTQHGCKVHPSSTRTPT